MNKATSGDGWAFAPATAEKPAIWAGENSLYNMGKERGALMLIAKIGVPVSLVLGLIAGSTLPFMVALALAVTAFVLHRRGNRTGEFVHDDWQLVTSADGLTYSSGSSWSASFDEIARIETGATVEWEKVRDYGSVPALIPDAEMQVFIFTDDGRRLVVHTSNAAREDCGRLAHSIRSYVEAARSTAAPSPAADPSSPAPRADGFDL